MVPVKVDAGPSARESDFEAARLVHRFVFENAYCHPRACDGHLKPVTISHAPFDAPLLDDHQAIHAAQAAE